MECPNCEKRPVGMFMSFRLNGVKFNKFLKGFFRCRHCETLLRIKRSGKTGLIPEYKKGFIWWYLLATAVAFAVILGFIFQFEETDLNFWMVFPIFFVLLMGYVAALDEIKARYMVVEETDPEKVRKDARRMGVLGWTVLLVFLAVMLGAPTVIDLFGDPLAIAGWQLIAGAIVYLGLIVGGSVGIFQYFSEPGELPERSEA